MILALSGFVGSFFVGDSRWENGSLLAMYTTYTVCLMHCLGFGCPILALGNNPKEQESIDIDKSAVEGVGTYLLHLHSCFSTVSHRFDLG